MLYIFTLARVACFNLFLLSHLIYSIYDWRDTDDIFELDEEIPAKIPSVDDFSRLQQDIDDPHLFVVMGAAGIRIDKLLDLDFMHYRDKRISVEEELCYGPWPFAERAQKYRDYTSSQRKYILDRIKREMVQSEKPVVDIVDGVLDDTCIQSTLNYLDFISDGESDFNRTVDFLLEQENSFSLYIDFTFKANLIKIEKYLEKARKKGYHITVYFPFLSRADLRARNILDLLEEQTAQNLCYHNLMAIWEDRIRWFNSWAMKKANEVFMIDIKPLVDFPNLLRFIVHGTSGEIFEDFQSNERMALHSEKICKIASFDSIAPPSKQELDRIYEERCANKVDVYDYRQFSHSSIQEEEFANYDQDISNFYSLLRDGIFNKRF